jgi:hypothetical protein
MDDEPASLGDAEGALGFGNLELKGFGGEDVPVRM